MLKLHIVVLSMLVALGPGPVVGGKISHERAKEILDIALAKVAAKDGPYYTLGEIVSADNPAIYPNHFLIKASLLDINSRSSLCSVNIYKKHWEVDGLEITAVVFGCPYGKHVVTTYIE